MRRLCKTLFHHGWLRSSTFLPLPSSSSWLYFTLNLVRGHTLPYHKMYQVNGSAHLQQRNNLANSFKNVQLTATTFEKNLEKDDFTGTNITIKTNTYWIKEYFSSYKPLWSCSIDGYSVWEKIKRIKDKELFDDLAKDSVPALRHEYKETKLNTKRLRKWDKTWQKKVSLFSGTYTKT